MVEYPGQSVGVGALLQRRIEPVAIDRQRCLRGRSSAKRRVSASKRIGSREYNESSPNACSPITSGTMSTL